jgi:hypothetical protein
MIVRKEPDGGMILIGQTDHSRLVGQLAAHWGNDRFATPRPFESVARAAAFHDYGWLRYETAPHWDPATGETPEFRKAPQSLAQIEAYEWCADWLLAGDPYAALIARMHRTGLSRARYDMIAHPPSVARPSLPEMTASFVARSEARQEEDRTLFNEDEVWTNYRLLQVWDLLGLYFCCQDPYQDHIEPVPQNYGAARDEGVRLTMTPVDTRRVVFDPYPFATPGLRIQLASRRLAAVSYPDKAAFERAYFQAEVELTAFELLPA